MHHECERMLIDWMCNQHYKGDRKSDRKFTLKKKQKQKTPNQTKPKQENQMKEEQKHLSTGSFRDSWNTKASFCSVQY